MARETQLNVRSAFARERVRELTKATGMTAAQVIDDALKAYVPPVEIRPVGALVRRGRILVMPGGRGTVSLDQANAELDAIRNWDGGS